MEQTHLCYQYGYRFWEPGPQSECKYRSCRQMWKAANFALHYGAGPNKIQEALGMTSYPMEIGPDYTPQIGDKIERTYTRDGTVIVGVVGNVTFDRMAFTQGGFCIFSPMDEGFCSYRLLSRAKPKPKVGDTVYEIDPRDFKPGTCFRNQSAGWVIMVKFQERLGYNNLVCAENNFSWRRISGDSGTAYRIEYLP